VKNEVTIQLTRLQAEWLAETMRAHAHGTIDDHEERWATVVAERVDIGIRAHDLFLANVDNRRRPRFTTKR